MAEAETREPQAGPRPPTQSEINVYYEEWERLAANADPVRAELIRTIIDAEDVFEREGIGPSVQRLDAVIRFLAAIA